MPRNKKLFTIKPKGLVKVLKKLGFYIYRQKGSHLIMIKDNDKRFQPVIPMHNKELKKGTLNSIITQAGLTREEFNELRKKK